MAGRAKVGNTLERELSSTLFSRVGCLNKVEGS
jgi:hypothetical protein